MQQFDFTTVHKEGKSNIMSRSHSKPSTTESNRVELATIAEIALDDVDTFYLKIRSKILQKPSNYPQWMIKGNFVYKLVSS